MARAWATRGRLVDGGVDQHSDGCDGEAYEGDGYGIINGATKRGVRIHQGPDATDEGRDQRIERRRKEQQPSQRQDVVEAELLRIVDVRLPYGRHVLQRHLIPPEGPAQSLLV